MKSRRKNVNTSSILRTTLLNSTTRRSRLHQALLHLFCMLCPLSSDDAWLILEGLAFFPLIIFRLLIIFVLSVSLRRVRALPAYLICQHLIIALYYSQISRESVNQRGGGDRRGLRQCHYLLLRYRRIYCHICSKYANGSDWFSQRSLRMLPNPFFWHNPTACHQCMCITDTRQQLTLCLPSSSSLASTQSLKASTCTR